MQKKHTYLLVGLVTFCLLAFAAITGVQAILNSGIIAGPDQKFGDQHLKTAVALIELHKVRYGKYPSNLSELKFTGDWDAIALQRVSYNPNRNQTAYYIEVSTGWIGKPDIEMPEDFWQGTGYNEKLRPAHP